MAYKENTGIQQTGLVITDKLGTVSYTHLDVYKRQVQITLFGRYS